MKTETIKIERDGREIYALRRHSDNIQGIAYDVTTAGNYRYLNIYHKPSGKVLISLCSRPIKKIREAIRMCESYLSKYDWNASEYSEKELKGRCYDVCALRAEIYNKFAI